ncbi:MAG: SDR family oxidoreductase [Polyangiaceae bacterium]|nr:SDR family oxidoreductase [Polyangiaceae bacterium]
MDNVVAVSGATGFIGSAVVRRLLRDGRTVRALIEPGANEQNLAAHPGVDRVHVDVRDYVAMARALDGCSAFYHLAAVYKVWTPDPTQLYAVNIEGTTSALLAAKTARVPRIVYTSSIAAVGGLPGGEPSDETVPFNHFEAANPYILSKYLSERVALRFAESGLPVVVVNPAFPFGPGDLAPTPTGAIILSILRRQVPGLPAGGFCAADVDDVAAGHVAAETRGRIGERYILGNHNISMRDFVQLVGRIAGVHTLNVPIPSWMGIGVAAAMEAVSKHVTHSEPLATVKSAKYVLGPAYFNPAKARAELDLPCTPLEETIERAVRFFRDSGMAP